MEGGDDAAGLPQVSGGDEVADGDAEEVKRGVTKTVSDRRRD
jgi:hypothetical protein